MTKKPSSYSSFVVAETLHYPLLVLGFIVTAVIYNYYADFLLVSRQLIIQVQDNLYPVNPTSNLEPETMTGDQEKLPFAVGEGSNTSGCDVFSGRWARDYARPLYDEWECPYIGAEFRCQKYGRPEKDYLFWKWQPHACSIPSFNATLMLEALRGKRMMFVGDSLNRGQFQSMVCLLQGAIRDERAKTFETLDPRLVFTAKDYNATIEFYWAPFLLESNSDDPLEHRVSDRIIRNGSVDKHGQHWKQSDILVFNTYIWWVSGVKMLRGGSFEDEVQDIVKVGRDDAFRVSMRSLREWVDKNLDPRRTRAFFTTMSPTHQCSSRWLGDPDGNCYNETTMIQDPNYFAAERSLMAIADEELGKSAVPITFLNITKLSSVRKDAHTSIYKKLFAGFTITEEQLANPKSYADCIHWCLPGLQDIWNELLFYKLFYP